MSVRPTATPTPAVDGEPVGDMPSLVAGGARPPRIAGLALSAPAGGRFFVDDVTVVPGLAAPGDSRWAEARAPEGARRLRRGFRGHAVRAARARRRLAERQRPGLGAAGPAGAGRRAGRAGRCRQCLRRRPRQRAGPVRPTGRHRRSTPPATSTSPTANNHRIQKFAARRLVPARLGTEGRAAGRVQRAARRRGGRRVRLRRRHLEPARAGVRPRRPARCSPSPARRASRARAASSSTGKRIYVAEAGGGRVTVYDRAGALQQTIGTLGAGPGQLIEPVDVAVDSHGDVWVVNSGNNRLEHFAADGTPRGSIPVPGLDRQGPQGDLPDHRRRGHALPRRLERRPDPPLPPRWQRAAAARHRSAPALRPVAAARSRAGRVARRRRRAGGRAQIQLTTRRYGSESTQPTLTGRGWRAETAVRTGEE